MAFCSNCGKQLNDGTRFCPKCGKDVSMNFARQNDINQYQQEEEEGITTLQKIAFVLFGIVGIIGAIVFLIMNKKKRLWKHLYMVS